MTSAYFDIADLDPARIYKLLASTVVPRPIAWTVTRNAAGQLNAAPFSFFNFFSGIPPVVCIGMGANAGQPKDTLVNIRETGELVINMVAVDMVEQMNTTAVSFPAGTNELDKARLETTPCVQVNLPRITNSPVSLECKLWQVLDLNNNNSLMLAHVVGIHITERAVRDAEKCHIDGSELHLVGRMQSPGWYTRTDDRFLLKQLSVDQWNAASANQGTI